MSKSRVLILDLEYNMFYFTMLDFNHWWNYQFLHQDLKLLNLNHCTLFDFTNLHHLYHHSHYHDQWLCWWSSMFPERVMITIWQRVDAASSRGSGAPPDLHPPSTAAMSSWRARPRQLFEQLVKSSFPLLLLPLSPLHSYAYAALKFIAEQRVYRAGMSTKMYL